MRQHISEKAVERVMEKASEAYIKRLVRADLDRMFRMELRCYGKLEKTHISDDRMLVREVVSNDMHEADSE